MGWYADLAPGAQDAGSWLTAALVYGEYAKTSNLFAVAIYLTMLIGGQTAQIGMLPCLLWGFFSLAGFPRTGKLNVAYVLDADFHDHRG
jgi:hypothetical protein